MVRNSSRGDHRPPGSLLIIIGKPILLLLVLGGAYLIFYRTFHIGIPCVFRQVTGLQCPGCGMTHAIEAVSKGDFKAAMQYNAMSLTVFPVTCIYLLYRYIRQTVGKSKKDFYVWEYILLAFLLILVLVYGYMRNQ